ncbi:MAG: hypothetical protein PWQ84_1608 [Thermotogaceae bacterium]|nr:hypothetical protein [Thermotogaceae bacterium]
MKYLILENDDDQISYINVDNIESFTHDEEQGTVSCTCTSGAQHVLIEAEGQSIEKYLPKLVLKLKWDDTSDIDIISFNRKFIK